MGSCHSFGYKGLCQFKSSDPNQMPRQNWIYKRFIVEKACKEERSEKAGVGGEGLQTTMLVFAPVQGEGDWVDCVEGASD